MRAIVTACLVLSLVVTLGCTRRVEITKPSGQILINDRVVDIVSDKSMSEVISKAPVEKQADLIREWIATKERLAAQVMNNEDKKSQGFWSTVADILKYMGPAAAGYFLAK